MPRELSLSCFCRGGSEALGDQVFDGPLVGGGIVIRGNLAHTAAPPQEPGQRGAEVGSGNINQAMDITLLEVVIPEKASPKQRSQRSARRFVCGLGLPMSPPTWHQLRTRDETDRFKVRGGPKAHQVCGCLRSRPSQSSMAVAVV